MVVIQKRAVNIEAVKKHVEVSDIRMKDATLAGASTYARFDAAYGGILCCGLAMLELAKKEVSSEKGHHQEILEFIVEELDFKDPNAANIKALARSRNANRYGKGPPATEKMVQQAIALAERVRAEAETWMTKHLPSAPKS